MKTRLTSGRCGNPTARPYVTPPRQRLLDFWPNMSGDGYCLQIWGEGKLGATPDSFQELMEESRRKPTQTKPPHNRLSRHTATMSRRLKVAEIEVYSDRTPPSLEAMREQQEQRLRPSPEPERTPSRFLSLPQEIRDMIYKIILVADTPLEFSPFADCSCNVEDRWDEHLGRRRGLNDYDFGDYWHRHRWSVVFRSALSLLRVCRQIIKEAAPVYYGQPFRFSSEYGWLALRLWLEHIGPRNRQFLKSITVCHPGLGTRLDHWTAFRHVADSHLIGPVGIYAPPHDPWSCLATHHKAPDVRQRWPGWNTLPHAAYLLAEAKDLRELKLLIKRSNMHIGEWKLDFSALIDHPVHSHFNTHQSDVKLSVVNFISARDELRTMHPSSDNSETTQSSPGQREAQQFYKKMREQGWHVVEETYDCNNSYPKEAGCNDEELCNWVYDSFGPEVGWCWHQAEREEFDAAREKEYRDMERTLEDSIELR